MSLLIKGFNMPTSCSACEFNDAAYCWFINTPFCEMDTDFWTERAKECPLVEVEHE